MKTTKKKASIVTFLFGGVACIIFLFLSYSTIEYTSSTSFCLKCHINDTPSLAESYKQSIHHVNKSGVRTECSDCHIPHQFIPKMITKINAVNDVIAQIRGTLDSPEKWAEKGPELFASARKQISSRNSITCKRCHDMASMDFPHQSHAASVIMPAAFEKGQDNCVTCHMGVGHAIPAGAQRTTAAPPLPEVAAVTKAVSADLPSAVPDPPVKYPAGTLGDLVKLGENIFNNTNTHPLTSQLVGNLLTCSSCHLNGGKTKKIGTLIGSAAVFPAYSGREKSIQTLQNRNNNCFMRSMNGIRPAVDSKASLALAAYVTWLSEGVDMKMNAKKPVTSFYSATWPGNKWSEPLVKAATHENYLAGERLYKKRCTVCHNQKGMPWLWGPESYNAGAGMSKLNKAPMWLMANMPMGNETLSCEDAVNLSLYINSQPRPGFDLTAHLPVGELYNSNVHTETSSVISNFKAYGLDLKQIRGEAP